eukprot:Skav206594  [mRNA]  locus=scaffold4512:54145:57303:- [translate_table: standard]
MACDSRQRESSSASRRCTVQRLFLLLALSAAVHRALVLFGFSLLLTEMDPNGTTGVPRSAPGPSGSLLQEEIEAQKGVTAAKGTTRAKLQEALQRLRIVEAKLEEAKGDQADYPLPDYLKEASSSGNIMLAVTGASGVGKSSLVNSLRKVKDTDPDAAKTGVKETTLEPSMYTFRMDGLFNQRFYRSFEQGMELRPKDQVLLQDVPGTPDGCQAEVISIKHQKVKVRLDGSKALEVDLSQVAGKTLDIVAWDLPGAGTPNFPQATYLKRMGIRYFDVAILVTSSRFTEAELMLATELEKFKVPFFMVRNKVDIDIDSEVVKAEESLIGDDGEEHELSKSERTTVAEQTIQCIKDYFRIEYGLDKVYCISTRRKLRKSYDYPSLQRAILEAVQMQR